MANPTAPFEHLFIEAFDESGSDVRLTPIAESLAPHGLTGIWIFDRDSRPVAQWTSDTRRDALAPLCRFSVRDQKLHLIEDDEGITACATALTLEKPRAYLAMRFEASGRRKHDLETLLAPMIPGLLVAAIRSVENADDSENLKILQVRNEQLLRQQEALNQEHRRILEVSLKERDERIREQRGYLERLELEVRLRTAEIQEQAQLLQAANRRMSRDLASAARIQMNMLPTVLPNHAGLNFAWRFRPCDELAGDSLNVFDIDEDFLGMYLLDVSGHGVPAALLSVSLSRVLSPSPGSVVKAKTDEPPGYAIVPPALVAKRLNEMFPMNDKVEQYFTLIYGVLNRHTREFRYVSAGHPGLVHHPYGEKPVLKEVCSFAVGWFEEAEYEENIVQLNPGDRIYVYSDGVTESTNLEETQFGNERLLQSIEGRREDSLDVAVNSLLESVVHWTSERQPTDDLSILACEIDR